MKELRESVTVTAEFPNEHDVDAAIEAVEQRTREKYNPERIYKRNVFDRDAEDTFDVQIEATLTWPES